MESLFSSKVLLPHKNKINIFKFIRLRRRPRLCAKNLVKKKADHSTPACRHGLYPGMNADGVADSFMCPWVNATADSATGG